MLVNEIKRFYVRKIGGGGREGSGGFLTCLPTYLYLQILPVVNEFLLLNHGVKFFNLYSDRTSLGMQTPLFALC